MSHDLAMGIMGSWSFIKTII